MFTTQSRPFPWCCGFRALGISQCLRLLGWVLEKLRMWLNASLSYSPFLNLWPCKHKMWHPGMVNTTLFPRTLGLGLGIGSQMRALGHSSKITWPLDNYRERKKVKMSKWKQITESFVQEEILISLQILKNANYTFFKQLCSGPLIYSLFPDHFY